MTNMNAYIKKCTGDHCGDDHGVFNCDLHKSINKSTLNLSNITYMNEAQNNKSFVSAIGSGRPTYKNYQTNPFYQQESYLYPNL